MGVVPIGIEVEPNSRRETLGGEIYLRGVLLWLIAFVFSLVAAWLLLRGESDTFPWLAALCHLLACVLTGLGTGVALGLSGSNAWGWASLTVFFAFLVGPVGVVLGVVCCLLARGQPTGMPLLEVIKAEMWIRQEDIADDDLAPLDLRIREELRTEPFVDLLPYADATMAMAIVKLLRERGSKRDIQMLRSLTQDKRPEVYQAAIAQLDKMESHFNSRFFDLAKELEISPHRTELRLELANMYLEYRESGLLEDGLEDYYWELTLSQILEAMLAHPGGTVLTVDLARLLYERGLVDEALAVAETRIKKDPHTLQGQLLVLESLFSKAQSQDDPAFLTEAKKRALGAAWAVRVPAKPTPGDPTHDLAKFWFKGREQGA